MNECLLLKHQRSLICVIAFLLCPLSFFIPRSATWLLTVGGLLGFIVCKETIFKTIKLPLSLTILALILWGGLSTFWSLDPKNSLMLFGKLLASYALGIGWYSLLQLQSPEDLKSSQFYLLLGIFVTFALITIDYLLGNPWQELCCKSSAKAFVPVSLTLSMALWPALLSLHTKYNIHVALLFLIGTPFFLFLVDCDTAPFGLLAGFIIGGVSYIAPKLISRVGQFLSGVLILSLPFAIYSFLTIDHIHQINTIFHNFSHIHRLYVWQNVSEKIQEHWVKGYGLDTSRHEALGGEKKIWTVTTIQGDVVPIHSKAIPMHPHNAPLQWWLELGIVGAMLGVLLHFQCLSYLSRYRGILSFTGMGLFTSCAFIAWINLGFWQNWWLAVLWILGGLFISSLPTTKTQN